MSLLGHFIKPIQEEADIEAAKILAGQYKDLPTITGAIERRKGLLKAIELLKSRSKHDDTSED